MNGYRAGLDDNAEVRKTVQELIHRLAFNAERLAESHAVRGDDFSIGPYNSLVLGTADGLGYVLHVTTPVEPAAGRWRRGSRPLRDAPFEVQVLALSRAGAYLGHLQASIDATYAEAVAAIQTAATALAVREAGQ